MSDPAYREAQRAKAREYRATEKGRAATQARIRRHQQAKVDKINALKSATPCADCSTKYPAVCMDFDHVRGTKLASVAELIRRASWARIQAEIDKCELVCANCHRIRSQTQHDQRRITSL